MVHPDNGCASTQINELSALKKMSYQTMKRHRRIANAYCKVKEGNLKKLCVIPTSHHVKGKTMSTVRR